jgi:hypothetical protein
MFMMLDSLLPRRGDVFLVHPLQLGRWLDEAWAAQRLVPTIPGSSQDAPFLGDASIVDSLDLPNPSTGGARPPRPSGIDLRDPDIWTDARASGSSSSPGIGLVWHHLMYAYLVESSGVFEVFAEVMRRLVVGESVGVLTPPSVKWVRATEELFFREPPLFSIQGVVSELRPSARVNRRNAYHRMFGLDLPHPVPARWGPSTGTPWKQDTGAGVNTDFRAKWSELLRQVWLGIENRKNTSGTNSTDANYVALLCRALRDMLGNRRRGGLLAREEFAYVTTLSWFHLTLLQDFPIIVDLRARATSPEERLANVAQLVGMSPAARSRELLLLAEKASALLRAIELGMFDSPADASRLYDGTVPQLVADLNDIINLWQSATGERVKDRPAGTTTVSSPQPLRIPTPTPGPLVGASTDGRAGSNGGGG